MFHESLVGERGRFVERSTVVVAATPAAVSSAVGVVGDGGSDEDAEEEGGLGLWAGLSEGHGGRSGDGQLEDSQEGQSEDDDELHDGSLQRGTRSME